MLLGFDAETDKSMREPLTDRLNAAAYVTDDRELVITVIQAEAVAAAWSCDQPH